MKVDYMVAFSGIQKQQILDKYGLEGGRTQKVIDSTFMGYLDKYMPADENQQMITSMYNSTKVGSGEVNINTPYAHYQYEGILYVNPKHNSTGYPFIINQKGEHVGFKGPRVPSGRKLNYHGGANRGDHFVERMLADHFDDILNAGQKEIDK